MPSATPIDTIPVVEDITDEIAAFERFLRDSLIKLSEVTECVGTKIYNSIAKQGKDKPYLIYNVIPLDDTTGQGGLSIQTRLYCDIQIYAGFPHPPAVDTAVAAIKDFFSTTQNNTYGGWCIAVRRYRPISRTASGATANENIVVRGGTYKAWISKA